MAASSTYPKSPATTPNPTLDDTSEAKRVYGALSEGGNVQMPVGETFFAPAFGMCVDRFGQPWMVMVESPAATGIPHHSFRPSVSDFTTVDDSQRSAAQYDAMADTYAADNLDSPFNAYYERPATKRLLGDVSGKQVLEVGCGAGPLTEWLVDQGAVVTAMDVSPGMVHLAQARLGDRARIVVSDLAGPLPFGEGSFDLVVASLVLHYLDDWSSPLTEIRRVLTADGAFVFSTHHPTMDAQIHSPEDYFATKQVTEVWSSGFEVTFWRRPLTAMTEAIYEAGFLVERLIEPTPDPELSRRDPDKYRLIATQPRFLFFRLKPIAPPYAL